MTSPATASKLNVLHDLRASQPAVRRAVLAVREWALANGFACTADALTVVLGTVAADAAANVAATEWSEERVLGFLWVDALRWCRSNGVGPPSAVGQALWIWLEYQSARGELQPGPSGIAGLGRAISSCAGPAGKPKIAKVAAAGRHPAGSARGRTPDVGVLRGQSGP